MNNEEILRTFLKYHSVYDKFRKNYREEFKGVVKGKLDAEEALGFAFNWSNTTQGHKFWGRLDDEWITMARKFKLEGYINLRDV